MPKPTILAETSDILVGFSQMSVSGTGTEIYCNVTAVPGSATSCRRSITLNVEHPTNPAARDFTALAVFLSEFKVWFADANGNPVSGRQLTQMDVQIVSSSWNRSQRELTWVVEARFSGEMNDTLGFLASATFILANENGGNAVASFNQLNGNCSTNIQNAAGCALLSTNFGTVPTGSGFKLFGLGATRMGFNVLPINNDATVRPERIALRPTESVPFEFPPGNPIPDSYVWTPSCVVFGDNPATPTPLNNQVDCSFGAQAVYLDPAVADAIGTTQRSGDDPWAFSGFDSYTLASPSSLVEVFSVLAGLDIVSTDFPSGIAGPTEDIGVIGALCGTNFADDSIPGGEGGSASADRNFVWNAILGESVSPGGNLGPEGDVFCLDGEAL